jgi:branched-chain amino acid transport system substrate-binding protein
VASGGWSGPVIITARRRWGSAGASHGLALSCEGCGATTTTTASGQPVTVPDALVDNCFGLPLWLQTPCAGHPLWAFNARHLAYLKQFLPAELRERRDEALHGSSASNTRLDKASSDWYGWLTSLGCLGRYLVSVRLVVDFGSSAMTAVYICEDGRRGLALSGEPAPAAGDGSDDVTVQVVGDFLGRAARAAVKLGGEAVTEVTLGCPAGWDAAGERVLLRAAAAAGLGEVSVVARPEAAAALVVDVLGNEVPDRSALARTAASTTLPAAVPAEGAVAPAPAGGAPAALPARRRRRVPVAVVGAGLVLALVAGAVVAWRWTLEHRGGPGDAARPAANSADLGKPASPGRPDGVSSSPTSGAAAIGPPVCGKSIGFMGPLSGPEAALGTPTRDGMQLAVNEYNAQHPSCTAALLTFDTQGDDVRVPAAVARIPSEVLGLIGPVLTGETEAAGPLLDKAGLPFFTLSSTDSLGGRGRSTFHRVTGSNTQAGEAAMRYLAQHVGARKVYVVAQANEYGQSLLAAARRSGLVQVVAATTLGAGTDYRRLATIIRSSGADSVYLASYTKEALNLLQPLRAGGFDGTVIAAEGALTQQFGAQAPNTSGSTYVICGCRYPDEQTTAGSQFAAAYTRAYHTDMAEYSGIAYDAAGMLLAGLAGGAGTRATMTQHLASIRYTGVMGDYRFTDRGELVAPHFGVFRLASGELTFDDSI